MEQLFLRPTEAAAILQVSHSTIYRWVVEGKLEGIKLSRGTLRIFRTSVEQKRAALDRDQTRAHGSRVQMRSLWPPRLWQGGQSTEET